MTILKLLRLADAFTIGNAALGFLAITYISDAKYLNAEVLLLLAVVADGVDGIVARRFGGGKESMGDYLDIMADYLSFCVAPAILFYQVYFDVAATPFQTLPQDILVGLAAALLVIFGLLRLARHVAKKGPDAGRFTGLPTTGAGLLTVLLIAEGGLGDLVTALLVGIVAVLMVTEVPYPKVRGPAAVASGSAVVAAAVVLLAFPAGATVRDAILIVAIAGAAAYAVSGVAFMLARVPLGHRGATPERATGARMVGQSTEEADASLDAGIPIREQVEERAALKEANLAQVTADQQRLRLNMDATMKRLAEREARLQKLKERIRTQYGERDEEEGRKAADRLREIDRRESELDRREVALAKREKGVARQDPTKGKRARHEPESQEIDPDA